MSHHLSSTCSIVALVLVFASAVGTAHADDSNLSRFSDDSYAYVDQNRPFASNAASTFRKAHPNGLSEREYQELSSEGPVWHRPAVTDTTASTFRESHPNGLSDREYQALSSNSFMWQSTSPTSATKATR
jgi:hypothetical protein